MRYTNRHFTYLLTYLLYEFFSARRYVALTASVNFRKSSPKTARNEQVCASKVLQEVNFPKSFLSSCIQNGS